MFITVENQRVKWACKTNHVQNLLQVDEVAKPDRWSCEKQAAMSLDWQNTKRTLTVLIFSWSNIGFMLVVTVCVLWSKSVNVEETSSCGFKCHRAHNHHNDVRTHYRRHILVFSIHKGLIRETKQAIIKQNIRWDRLRQPNSGRVYCTWMHFPWSYIYTLNM